MSNQVRFLDVEIGAICTVEIDGEQKQVRRILPQQRHRDGDVFNVRVIQGIHSLAYVSGDCMVKI